MKQLWLDDIRIPPSYDWLWVRTYEQFVEAIEDLGCPDMISFDHDLGAKVPVWWHREDGGYDKEIMNEQTGYDCAKWLVDYCMDNKTKLPSFKVHSANPVGKENIEKLLNNFMKI